MRFRWCFWLPLALLASSAANGGSLAGRVTRTGGQALASTFVDLYDEDGEYFDYTVTDSSGNYRFDNLGSGGFYVHTDTLGGYAEEWYDDVPGASEDTFFEPIKAGATLVAVGYNDTVTGVNIALEQAGAIAGRVTDSTGGPVAGAYVDAYLADGERFLYDLTDADGKYVLAGLPAGLYMVRTDSSGAFIDRWHDQTEAFDSLKPADAGVTSLLVTAGSQLANVDMQLRAGSEVRGTLRNGVGDPVRGAYVDLLDSAGRALEFDRSDTNGLYQLRGLPAGVYYLGTDSLGSYVDIWYEQAVMINPKLPATDGADLLTVPDQAVVPGIDFTLDIGATVSGHVISTTGQDVVKAFVDVYRETNFFDYVLVGTNGLFEVTGLPDGTYYIRVDTLGSHLDEWHDNAVVLNVDDPIGDGAFPLVVTNGNSVTGIVFELRRGAEVAGRVTDANGHGIAGLYVDLCDASGASLFYTRSDTNGSYRLGGFPGGTYYVGVDSDGGYADEWYDDRPVISATNPVADGASAIALSTDESRGDVDLLLRRGGSVSGTVVTTNDVPLVDAVVNLYYGARLFDRGTTDSNGVYGVDALPDGTYYLRADSRSGFLGEWYSDSQVFDEGDPVADGATAVVVSNDASRSGLDFELGTGGRIEGVVKTEAGAAIRPSTVDLFDSQGRYYDFASPLMNGSYSFDSLPPGTWFIGADSFGAYQDEWFDNVARIRFVTPIADGASPLAVAEGGTVSADFFLSLLPPDAVVLGLEQNGGESMVIEWEADANQAYQVERRLDLRNGEWEDAPSGAIAIELSLKAAGAAGLRQYRDPSPPVRAVYRVLSL